MAETFNSNLIRKLKRRWCLLAIVCDPLGTCIISNVILYCVLSI